MELLQRYGGDATDDGRGWGKGRTAFLPPTVLPEVLRRRRYSGGKGSGLGVYGGDVVVFIGRKKGSQDDDERLVLFSPQGHVSDGRGAPIPRGRSVLPLKESLCFR